jgi:hypothetical protein
MRLLLLNRRAERREREMRRQAALGALVLVGVGVVLGATVFRSDIAQATGLAQAVTVANTAAQAVPVREQNLDANGNIKVHEQGTAKVSDSDSPGRTAVYYQAGISLSAVPAGHRLIVTFVTAEANQFTGAAGVGCTLERSDGTLTERLAFLRLEPTTGGQYVGSEQVFIPLAAGQGLFMDCGTVQNLNPGFGGYMTQLP